MSPRARKRRGRPSLVEGEQGEPVSSVLPKPVYDEACRLALRRGVTLSAVVRIAIERFVRADARVS